MGPLWAAIHLGLCLLCHGAPPTPLTLLFPPPSFQNFLPFFKHLFKEVPQSLPIGSPLACGGSIAEMIGTDCDWLWL